LLDFSKKYAIIIKNKIQGGNIMPDLKGTKTEQNLREAFAGE